MFAQIKTSFARSRGSLLPDAAGVIALMVMLIVGLHLPAIA